MRAIIDVTGTTPQTLAAAVAGKKHKILGFGITSSGDGGDPAVAIIKSGSDVVHQIALPGGEVKPPTRAWEIECGTNEALTIEADTAGVQVVGDLVYVTE